MFRFSLFALAAAAAAVVGVGTAEADNPWRGTQQSTGYSNPGFYRTDNSGPQYSGYNFAPATAPASADYTSGYYFGRREDMVPANAALLEMQVPANAEVWFSGEKTAQRGADRAFVTPELDQGRRYAYQIKVRWTDKDGKTVEREKKVPVRPGGSAEPRVRISSTALSTTKSPVPCRSGDRRFFHGYRRTFQAAQPSNTRLRSGSQGQRLIGCSASGKSRQPQSPSPRWKRE